MRRKISGRPQRPPTIWLSKSRKVLLWCIYTTTLEPILAKISETDEPAASRRKAAACLEEKLPYLLKEKIGARKIKK